MVSASGVGSFLSRDWYQELMFGVKVMGVEEQQLDENILPFGFSTLQGIQ